MKVYVVIYSDDFVGAQLVGVYYKKEDAESAARDCEYFCYIIESEVK